MTERSTTAVGAATPVLAVPTSTGRPTFELLTRRSGGPVVTRTDIADAVEGAFVHPPATKADLLEAAATANATEQLVAVLRQLPDRQYRTMRDLWPHLATVPVTA